MSKKSLDLKFDNDNITEFAKGIDLLTYRDNKHKKLNGRLICFHPLSDRGGKAYSALFNVVDFSNVDTINTSIKSIYKDLVSLNKNGYGIYWAVNEFGENGSVGGIPPTDSNKWRRLSENVTRIRALFVDIDTYLPKETILELSEKFGANLSITTSEKDGNLKSHIYWIFENDTPLNEFERYQQIIAYKIDDYLRELTNSDETTEFTDKKVKDLSRVLRVPGFYHLKDEPSLVKIVYTNKQYYTSLEEIDVVFNIDEDYLNSKKLSSYLSKRFDSSPANLPPSNFLENIEPGERNNAVYIYAHRLFARGANLCEALGAIKVSNDRIHDPLSDEEIEVTVESAWDRFCREADVRSIRKAEEGGYLNNPKEIIAQALKVEIQNKLAEITDEDLERWEKYKKEAVAQLDEIIGEENLYNYDYEDGPTGDAFLSFANPISEDSIVERLKQRYGDIIKYDPTIGFVVYDKNNGTWEETPERSRHIVTNFIKDIARVVPYEKEVIKRLGLIDKSGEVDFNKIATISSKVNSEKSMSYYIKKASSDDYFICDKHKEFNKHKFLLNCKNGVVDLRDGNIYPHSPKFKMTQQSKVLYEGNTSALFQSALKLESENRLKNYGTGEWGNFLYQVMQGDIEMCNYLQQIMGYSITGETSEQCCFFFFGQGRNGKSKFLDKISDVVSEYSAVIPSSALAAREYSDNNVLFALYKLLGSRIVKSDEITEKQKWNEALLKSFTGQDTISARPPRGSYVDFKPDFKIFFQGNCRPEITGTDEGVWRRLRIIEWGLNLSEDEEDKDLDRRLSLPEVQQDILCWLIAGAVKYYQQGEIYTPQKVWEQIESYRGELDPCRSFLKDCCILTGEWRDREYLKDNGDTIDNLLETFSLWAKENDIDTEYKNIKFEGIGSSTGILNRMRHNFSRLLSKHGYKSIVTSFNGESIRVYPISISEKWKKKVRDSKKAKVRVI